MDLKYILHAIINTGSLLQDDEQKKVTKMVNTFSIITITLCFLFGIIIYAATGKMGLLLPAFIEGITFTSVIFLNSIRKPVMASIAFIAINNVAIVYFSAVLGMITEVHLLFIFLLGASLMLFKTRPLIIASVIIAFLSLIACEVNYYYTFVDPTIKGHDQQFIIRWITIPAILFLDIATVFLYVKKLRVLNKKLEKATNEKTIFVRETSHEIRNPLNAIYGISQDLMMRVHKEEKYSDIKQEIEHLYSATHNVLQIINNILAISKIEEGASHDIQNEAFNVRELMADKIIVYQYIADIRGVKIKLDIHEGMPADIIADKGKLTQVLNNLLFNAIKFTKTNSIITISLARDNDQWQVLVRDQGAGIGQKQLLTLFTPFVAGKSDFEGTGLGLPITKKYVELMGGKIVVNSVVDEGTAFIVRLPLTICENALPTTKPSFMELTLHKGLKCLVIDDNEMSQLILASFLRRLGFIIISASNGVEGVNKAMDEKPDIIFIDSYMPGLSGKETLQTIREIPELKNIPVVAVSGDAFQESINDMLGAGASDYITKPIELKLLNSTLNKLLVQ
ncbi:signal transduction histidine kinase [Chitinophaga niastensis]|uniref:histidine kinase n=1 Tax=Chitinophaga niastensis TaxID=536980 RepID=A0A2P8HGL9_CHINA|nr:hybrid sensor histidine kinase/response regulator [Chitinophaga niastensis]PSL45352.1 signal transduction histidine kinase [Chitinophaga niastensis]